MPELIVIAVANVSACRIAVMKEELMKEGASFV
jgi:hypothetical protein